MNVRSGKSSASTAGAMERHSGICAPGSGTSRRCVGMCPKGSGGVMSTNRKEAIRRVWLDYRDYIRENLNADGRCTVESRTFHVVNRQDREGVRRYSIE